MTQLKSISLIIAALAFGVFYIGTANQESSDTSSQNEPPSTGVAFSLDVTSGDAPLKINVAVTERPEGEGWSYSWIFNDGPLVEGDSARHIYDEPGEYNIIVLAERNGEMKTATHIVDVSGKGKMRKVQVPLSIDYSDFPDAWQIVGLAGQAYLDSASSVPALLDRSTRVAVYDREGNLLTSDRVLPGIKDFIHLEAETGIKIQVFDMMVASGLSATNESAILARIAQHPRFAEAVELVREEHRAFDSEVLYQIKSQIADEVLHDLRNPDSNPSDEENSTSGSLNSSLTHS